MSIKLWLAKRTQRRIENYEQKIELFQHYITKTRGWIRSEKAILNKQLKECSELERIQFGHDMGFTERSDIPSWKGYR
jgi:hypothetical protein